MIQFSVRQLDTIKTSALEKILQLYKFYLVSFLICLAAALTGIAYLILTAIKSCSVEQIHIFTIITVLFYCFLVVDMLLSEKATLQFFNQHCKNLNLAENLTFKTFLQSVERLRYYSNQKEISVFQVREVLWNSMQIPYYKVFFLAQVSCWILYGISFFFAFQYFGKGCIHQHESLIIFIVYLYHNLWFIILVGFSLVVSVSAILFLPFIVCAYFKFNDSSEIPDDPEEQQKIFLQNQLENFQYDQSKAKDTLCAICLEDFQAEAPVKRTKCCKSIYHPICIKEWVVNSITCPNCRKSPFTKNNKNSQPNEVRVDSVVPLNNNILNTELNNHQGNNQIQNNSNNNNNNPIQPANNPNVINLNQNEQAQPGQIVNQNVVVHDDIVADIENQNIQQNEEQQAIENQQQEVNLQQQNSVHPEPINPQQVQIQHNNQGQLPPTVIQIQNQQNEDSYIIQFSDSSVNKSANKHQKTKELNDIQLQNNNNDIEQEQIQVVDDIEQIDQNKDATFEKNKSQNESSTNSKGRKKLQSTYTQADGINNNAISELHGQRLTIYNNIDGMAINSTEISTQKITIYHKNIDLPIHNAGIIDNFDVNDFDNTNENKVNEK
ncbi:hypothetical protein ABPG74_022805 [Tetrahymena malaccensis]